MVCFLYGILLYGFSFTIAAQNIPEVALQFPWAGGLNSCQFGSIDINLDGKPDLVIFDRFGNRILPFINEGSTNEIKYSYHPEYAALFPDLQEWVIFADYNCDGKQDIFTYLNGGVRVYKNISDTSLKFQLITNQLTSYYYTGKIGIFLTNVDYPAIADIDNDGDLDLLTFFGLGSYLEYHKNLSMEKYGNCDSLDFMLADKCWGDIKESEGGNHLTLDIVCPYKFSGLPGLSCNGPPPKHTGSTLLAADLDGNGVKDLIIGDIDFSNLISLINGGTVDSAHMISQDSTFPDNHPVKLYSLPACCLLDMDNDGIRDLVVSPFDPQYYISENKHSCWYFKNTGTNDLPVFQFQTNSFFQNQMIDVGTSSSPVIVDINGDGLPDLLVGNYGYFDSAYSYQGYLYAVFSSKISYFKNTGQPGNPEFHLETDDFAGLSSLHAQSLYPSFYDMDGDGDVDMITGNADGTLTYYNNTAGPGQEPVFAPAQSNYKKIDAGDFSAPQLFDLDGDGLPDLLIGNRKGTIIYYRNTGTRSSPDFTHITDSLGKVNVTNDSLYYDGLSTPFFFKDPSGKTGLIVGSKEGKVHYYTNIDGNLGGTFTLSDSLLSNLCGAALPATYGITSAACVAHVEDPDFMDLIVGNFSGGLNYFSHKTSPVVYTAIAEKEISSAPDFLVYPNPASDQVFLQPSKGFNTGYFRGSLYNSLGQPVVQTTFYSSNPVSFHVGTLPEGIYFLTVSPLSPGGPASPFTAKIVVIH
jgi:hypothetical protein